MKPAPVVACCLLLMLLTAPAAARDYSSFARNIIPSGQYGSVPPPAGADAQAQLYDGLTPLFDRVSTRDLVRYFKPAVLGTRGQGPIRRETLPRRGVRLLRDRWNVPHIYSRTNDGITFATGWVAAEDRELLLEQTRYVGRLAAIDAPGWNAIDMIRGLRNFTPTPQTEAIVARQTQVLRRAGRKGRAVLHDIDVFVSGINAYYRSKGRTYEPWGRNDVYALNAIKGQFLGQGGDGEVRSAQLLSGLRQRLGGTRGISVWNDLRQVQDPETAVSVPGRFRYGARSKARKGNVVIENGSFTPGPGAGPRADGGPARPASNVLMAGRRRSRSGHPLFVGGPQIGYFYPGLTWEVDLHGPGWSARGATSAPFPGYVLIGRREDFTWMLTSAGADIIDHYVERLCGSDTRYLYNGRCRDMGVVDAGVTSSGEQARFLTTVHGPVVGYARAGGRRVAISRKRSSYGRDVLDQLVFRDLNRSPVRTARAFIRAVRQTPQTFNSFYADNRSIAMYTTGRLPLRPRGVDTGLPTDGRGRYEWRGFLAANRHPRGINPRGGTIVNWNNKPARGFHAADDQFGQGSIQRDDLLLRYVNRRKRHTLASLTAAMNAGATQDVRAIRLVPVLAAVLRRGTSPSPRAARMLELLESWRANGGSRLDRDLDGRIDDPGAAVMDAAWAGLANAAMRPVLGPLADQLHDSALMRRFDSPPGGQSNGWHQYMDKDLRRLLGQRVRGPLRNRYCGQGNLATCATDLWAAIDAAGAQLALQQGDDPASWRADANRERITFTPGLLPTTIRYTNRPTGIQTVISFDGHRPRRR